MKRLLFIMSFLAMVTACAKSQVVEHTEHLSLVLADNPHSKVLVDGTSGEITWVPNIDQIAVWISGTIVNKYRNLTVKAGGTVDLTLSEGESRANYCVYPATSAVSGYYTSSNLRVAYPTSYDFSSLSLEQIADYAPYPMVAANDGSDVIAFYQVGGVLRLTLDNVPETTKSIYLSFSGKQITGDVQVTYGGTQYTQTTGPSGSSNLTFIIAGTSIGGDSPQTVTLNIPLPQGNYSYLSSISIYARDSSNTDVASLTYTLPSKWTTVTRAQGRKLRVSF